ncbi:serine/threonine-protein kinase [Streptomyces sp. NPDC058611]|uniref:serine/threonine-protein kinase n=1 Tax=Streptomyces sp. NPDC058611 TaxID=3346554 RepID=UPI00364F445A
MDRRKRVLPPGRAREYHVGRQTGLRTRVRAPHRERPLGTKGEAASCGHCATDWIFSQSRDGLATAYVPGPTLHEVVRRRGPLPARTVLLLVAGIAEALHGIHRAGVVHRDLTPANVLVAGDGPRVIDFGIARAADAAAPTGTGLRIGTAAFMAPEQAPGRQATPATDFFALGALAAYVAGGAPPFGPDRSPAPCTGWSTSIPTSAAYPTTCAT